MDIVDKIKRNQLHSTFVTWLHKKDLDSYLEFRTVYWEALKQNKENNDNSLRDTVIDYTLKVLIAARELKQDIPMWISNEILLLLAVDENLSKFIDLENSDTALAWFCCDRASSYVYPDKISHEHHFRTILSNWTDTSYMLGRPSLERVVTLIYGPACWGLYGTELNEDMDPVELSTIVHDIANANLPFYFKNLSSYDIAIQQILPDAFI